MPDRVPEDMPEHIAEDMPGRMPEGMPDRMPEDMPDTMPEDMSDRLPEDLPVTKRIDVMVMITRSEVIYCQPSSIFTSPITQQDWEGDCMFDQSSRKHEHGTISAQSICVAPLRCSVDMCPSFPAYVPVLPLFEESRPPKSRWSRCLGSHRYYHFTVMYDFSRLTVHMKIRHRYSSHDCTFQMEKESEVRIQSPRIRWLCSLY